MLWERSLPTTWPSWGGDQTPASSVPVCGFRGSCVPPVWKASHMALKRQRGPSTWGWGEGGVPALTPLLTWKEISLLWASFPAVQQGLGYPILGFLPGRTSRGDSAPSSQQCFSHLVCRPARWGLSAGGGRRGHPPQTRGWGPPGCQPGKSRVTVCPAPVPRSCSLEPLWPQR